MSQTPRRRRTGEAGGDMESTMIGLRRRSQDGWLFVEWQLSNVCNYACSYCIDLNHNGSASFPALRDIFSVCERLQQHAAQSQRELWLQLNGGEISLFSDFLPLLEQLKQSRIACSFMSNGSRSLQFWRRVAELGSVNQVIFSYHLGFTEFEHFIRVVNLFEVTPTNVAVNIVAHPERFDDSIAAQDAIVERCHSAVHLKPMIDYSSPFDHPFDYPEAQAQVLGDRATRTRPAPIRVPKHPTLDRIMVQEFASGERRVVAYPSLLISDGQNSFTGWQCDIGTDILTIVADGSVYRGICHEGGRLGSIWQHETLRLPVGSLRCSKASCNCLLDLSAEKWVGRIPGLPLAQR